MRQVLELSHVNTSEWKLFYVLAFVATSFSTSELLFPVLTPPLPPKLVLWETLNKCHSKSTERTGAPVLHHPSLLIAAGESCAGFTLAFVSPANIFPPSHSKSATGRHSRETPPQAAIETAHSSLLSFAGCFRAAASNWPPFFYISPCCLGSDSEALGGHHTHSFHPPLLIATLLQGDMYVF